MFQTTCLMFRNESTLAIGFSLCVLVARPGQDGDEFYRDGCLVGSEGGAWKGRRREREKRTINITRCLLRRGFFSFSLSLSKKIKCIPAF